MKPVREGETKMTPLQMLRHHVTGAIERGESVAVTERRAPGYNCRRGSAWHTWQCAGSEWRKANPTATADDALLAAKTFAHEGSGHPNEISARHRAFMQCA